MSKLYELDTTAPSTGVSNWLTRKRDALLGAAGSGTAIGRHTTRLVTNKLYRAWREYVGSQGKRGTADELAYFISQFYGPQRLASLSQMFPTLLPSTQQTPPTDNATAQSPSPQATPNDPASAAPNAANAPDDVASMTRYQNYVRRIDGLLRTAAPNPANVMRSVGAMLRDFSTRSDKAKDWVRRYIATRLSGYAQIIPDLAQFAGIDPFTLVPPRRQANSGQTNAGTTPGQTTGQPSNTSMPQPPNPWRSQPPPAFMRQKSESRRLAGRLIEADPALTIPQPPPGTKNRIYRQQPNMTQPPAFMQRQRNQPQPANPPPQPTQIVLKRAQVDQIFVALARMMIVSGDAGRVNSEAPRPVAAQRMGGNAAHPDISRVLHAIITQKALDHGYQMVGGQMSRGEYDKITQIIRTHRDHAPTLREIIGAMGTLSSGTVQALLRASEYV